jgi:rhodanese-related sulfurtransferase
MNNLVYLFSTLRNKMNQILIDIREEFELLEKHLKSNNENLLIFNIPMRSIFANKDVINELSQTNEIYIMCRTGCRSNKVKKLYFEENNNVISLDGGINGITENPEWKDKVQLVLGKGGFGVQQYIQITFVLILFVLLILIHMDVKKLHMEIIIASIILFLTYQILSKGCLISSMIPLSR